MYITKAMDYNEIVTDSDALDDLACQVFMELVHPFNYLTRAPQILRVLEADHHGRGEIAGAIKACHLTIEQAIKTLAHQVESLERSEGVTQKFKDFYAGYDC